MDTAKIRVRRSNVAPEGCVTGFSYIDPKKPDELSHFAADETKDEFDMTAAQADAAVATGGFEVHPDSKSAVEADATTAPLV